MAEGSGRDTGSRLGAIAPRLPGDPERVGRYAVLGRLGTGGMGTVYLARGDGPAAAFVAVKVVHPELAGDAAFRARFREEVAAARRVAPFCTARVVDADPQADPPYLVTEYVDGVPLGRVVGESGPLAESTVHGVAMGMAAALAAIHAAGLVHRDLKPANVLLSLSGPRVIDFGIARALDATSGLTVAGTVLGTPGWMAPEQFRGGTVGAAADVFSWGSVVAYAGTGRQPWGDEGPPAAFAYRIVHGEPDLAGLGGGVRPLVEAALRKDPAARPSARELVLALLGGGLDEPARAADPAAAATAAATSLLQGAWSPPAPRPARNGAAPRTAPRGPAASGFPGGGFAGRAVSTPPPTRVLPPGPLTGGPATGGPPGRPPMWTPYGHQAPPPAPGRRRWWRKKRYLIPFVLLVLLVVVLSSANRTDPSSGAALPGAQDSSVPRPTGGPTTTRPPSPTPEPTAGLGVPVRDGQLEFTVRSWRCGVRQLGRGLFTREPQGQFCLAEVRARNIGSDARTLFEAWEKLRDGGKTYSADFPARFFVGKQTLWDQVNPGNTVRGTLVFDIPTDARPEGLELHDGPVSGGALVPL